MNHTITGNRFLAALTVALVFASLWIFSPYLHYLLVAAVLALATSHAYNAMVGAIQRSVLPGWFKAHRRAIAAAVFTLFFLFLIFAPLLYFASRTYEQLSGLDIASIKQTIIEMSNRAMDFLDRIPVLHDLMGRFKADGKSLVNGASIEAVLRGAQKAAAGVAGLFGQIG